MSKKKKAKKKVGRPSTGKKTQVIRVLRSTYDFLSSLKASMQREENREAKRSKRKPRALTYDHVFDEVFECRRLIQKAPKVFELEGKLLRGFTLLQARQVAEAFANKRLRILLDIGDDK